MVMVVSHPRMTALATPPTIENDISALSSKRAYHKPATDSKKNPVLDLRWVLNTKSGRPTVGPNVTLT
jgi:hypothetical protein